MRFPHLPAALLLAALVACSSYGPVVVVGNGNGNGSSDTTGAGGTGGSDEDGDAGSDAPPPCFTALPGLPACAPTAVCNGNADCMPGLHLVCLANLCADDAGCGRGGCVQEPDGGFFP